MNHATTAAIVETVGLDVGDRRSSWCRLSAAGEPLGEGEVPTTRAGLSGLLAPLPPCRVVLEACGHVHWISALLRELGHEVVVANPRELRKITASDRKTDRNDARTLARLGRVDPGLLHPVTLRGEVAQVSRALLAARDHLVRVRTRTVTMIRGQVKSAGHSIRGGSARSFHKHAAAQIPPSLREVCGPLLTLLEQLAEQIAAYDRQIEVRSAEHHPDTALLRQVAGVGPVLALAYVATIEDPGRFASSRTVGSYVGLTPRMRSSGSRSPELSISKSGDRLLRRLLVNAASYILGPFGPDCDLRRHGEHLARGGSQRDRGRARIAVARKLACQLHHLWRTGAVWEPLHAAID